MNANQTVTFRVLWGAGSASEFVFLLQSLQQRCELLLRTRRLNQHGRGCKRKLRSEPRCWSFGRTERKRRWDGDQRQWWSAVVFIAQQSFILVGFCRRFRFWVTSSPRAFDQDIIIIIIITVTNKDRGVPLRQWSPPRRLGCWSVALLRHWKTSPWYTFSSVLWNTTAELKAGKVRLTFQRYFCLNEVIVWWAVFHDEVFEALRRKQVNQIVNGLSLGQRRCF